MTTTPKPSQIAILAGGATLFVFSFLTFAKPSFGDGVNAWSGDFLFPLTVIPALFGLIAAGTTAAVLFGNVQLPEQILTFNWRQITLVLGFTALVILLGIALSLGEGLDMGIGLILSVLGGIALVAGAVMELLGIEVGGSAGQGGPGQGGSSTPF